MVVWHHQNFCMLVRYCLYIYMRNAEKIQLLRNNFCLTFLHSRSWFRLHFFSCWPSHFSKRSAQFLDAPLISIRGCVRRSVRWFVQNAFSRARAIRIMCRVSRLIYLKLKFKTAWIANIMTLMTAVLATLDWSSDFLEFQLLIFWHRMENTIMSNNFKSLAFFLFASSWRSYL